MRQCLSRIKRRPIILVLLAVMALPLCIFDQYNSVAKKFGSFSLLFKDDFMTGLSNFADGIAASAGEPRIMALTIGVTVLFVLALSALLGVLCGGYFQNMYLAVNDAAPKKGDYKLGVNRHFGKMTAYFLLLICSFFLVAVLVLFSLVPFAMHLEMFLAGDSSVIFKMMLLAVVTILFGYFTIVFYSMYLSYMVPAIVGFKRGGVIVSFKMTNGYCWYLMPRTTLFLFLLLIDKVIMLALGYGTATGGKAILCLGINWVLTTVILFGYIYYVFNTFIIMKEDMFTVSDEG